MSMPEFDQAQWFRRRLSTQAGLIITMIIPMLIAVCFHASAKTPQTVNISQKNLSIEQVFKIVTKQTSYQVIYDHDLVKNIPAVDLNFKNASLNDVFSKCFERQPNIGFEIKYNTVIIREKESAGKFDATSDFILPADTIKGRVGDSLSRPLFSVSVSTDHSHKTVLTNDAGDFSIPVTPEDKFLILTFIGMKVQRQPLTGQSYYNIQMLPENAAELNDVVVVGYGTQKKQAVTGAIVSMDTKELLQSPVANLSNALAGRLPGLLTVQNSGEPGSDGSNLNIRGFGTTNNAAPLILVDGIPRDFTGIDANEVESVTILKDAASTAIYGIQGANGVILVTTKRGKIGSPQISVTANNAWQSPTELPKYVNSYQGLSLYKEGLINDGNFADTAAYSDDILYKYKNNTEYPAWKYIYPSVDWIKAMLKPYSYMRSANMNVTGGNEFAKYFVSLSYLQQNGLYNFDNISKQYNIQTVLNKYNFRSNVDLQLTKRLSMKVSLGAIVDDQNYPGTSASSIFTSLKQTPAWYYPMLNPDGSVGAAPNTSENPYQMVAESGYQRYFTTDIQSGVEAKWDMGWLTKGLSAKANIAFDNNNYRNVTRPLSINTYQYLLNTNVPDTTSDLITNGHYTLVSSGNGTLGYNVDANGTRQSVVQYYINYDRDFGKNFVHAMVLYNQSDFFNNIYSGQSNAEAGLPHKYQGYLTRESYSYDNRYFLEFDGAYNGSENFAPGHRFGFFPAVSAGWVLSNEHFIKNSQAFKFIDNLKLRGSYGESGNDQLGSDMNANRFGYLSTWSLSGSGYTFGLNDNGNSYSGAVEGQAGNVALTWEKKKSWNIGLDMDLWKGELSLTADVFGEHRSNILVSSQLTPVFIGLPNVPLVNAATTENRGYEISLTHKKEINTKEGYSVSVNYSFARNKVLFFDQPDYVGHEWQAEKGTQIGEIYGYTSLGLFKDQNDINNSPTQTLGSVIPGDIKYKDLNDDGQITSLDEGYLPGKVPYPTSQFGIVLSYHYAGFDISTLFQGGLGGSVYLSGSGIWPFSRFASAIEQVVNNHWVASNPDGSYMFPAIHAADNTNNEQPSNFWVYSTNYIRLKNVEIGYSLPVRYLKKIGIKSARIYVNGQNLLTWDGKLGKLKIDPEIANNSTGTYPQQKVINTGLTFSF